MRHGWSFIFTITIIGFGTMQPGDFIHAAFCSRDAHKALIVTVGFVPPSATHTAQVVRSGGGLGRKNKLLPPFIAPDHLPFCEAAFHRLIRQTLLISGYVYMTQGQIRDCILDCMRGGDPLLNASQ